MQIEVALHEPLCKQVFLMRKSEFYEINMLRYVALYVIVSLILLRGGSHVP